MESFLALFGIASAATWTPGPNNLMLAASGANFGYRRTLPHIFGVMLRFPVMVLIIAFGLGGVFTASPVLREAMRWAGAMLLLWFAWRIATAGSARGEGKARALTFVEAAGFQWVNPKSWAMALATTSQFVTGEDTLTEGLLERFPTCLDQQTGRETQPSDDGACLGFRSA